MAGQVIEFVQKLGKFYPGSNEAGRPAAWLTRDGPGGGNKGGHVCSAAKGGAAAGAAPPFGSKSSRAPAYRTVSPC